MSAAFEVSTTRHYLSVCVSHMASMMSRSRGSHPICWTDSSTSVCPIRAPSPQPSFLVCPRVQSWGSSYFCFTQQICCGWSGATSFNLTLMPMTPKSTASSILWQPLALSVECHPLLMTSLVGWASTDSSSILQKLRFSGASRSGAFSRFLLCLFWYVARLLLPLTLSGTWAFTSRPTPRWNATPQQLFAHASALCDRCGAYVALSLSKLWQSSFGHLSSAKLTTAIPCWLTFRAICWTVCNPLSTRPLD